MRKVVFTFLRALFVEGRKKNYKQKQKSRKSFVEFGREEPVSVQAAGREVSG